MKASEDALMSRFPRQKMISQQGRNSKDAAADPRAAGQVAGGGGGAAAKTSSPR